jgi:DNA-binding winged helix-turn-helix (wHTH) protein/tetratricopeptide (TPR) repeat protein
MSLDQVHNTKMLYEFGPFRVDPDKETLARGGELVPLTPKTFQILLVLVRHNREVVTKDDLMRTVWPDTFVEEANLSRNIFMLRKALGDNSQDRFIVTVPGRGYRLAEDVHLIPGQELSVVAATHSKVEVQVTQSKPWAWLAFAAIVVVTLVGIQRFSSKPRQALTEKDTVVLADFANTTGDPVFDDTLRQGMEIQLEQSPFLSLVSEPRIRHTLKMMGQKADTPLNRELGREVCARTGSAALLEGSIASLGSQYVVGMRAEDCRTGDLLDEEQAQAARKEDVLNMLSQMTSKFRTRLGESLATVKKHNTPLADATTSSFAALEAYSDGWKVLASSGAMAALPLFRRATEIDPKFAMAHASLGRIYSDLDESDLAAASTTTAWTLRDRASDEERFFITASYEVLVTGNVEKARQTLHAWTQAYPRMPRPHNMSAGIVHKTKGEFEQAVLEAQQAIALDPDFGISYYSLAVNNAYLERPERAQDALRLAATRGLDIEEFTQMEYNLDFLRGDRARMEQLLKRPGSTVAGESWMANNEAFASAYLGSIVQARNLTRRAVDQARQSGQEERADLWQAAAAVREALVGNRVEALKQVASARKLTANREVEYGAALAYAWSGESARAQALADDLEKRFPEDTAVLYSYLPTLRARLALNRGDAAMAIEALRPAIPNELGVPNSAVHALFGALYPVYERGEAYLLAGQSQPAILEFRKILDHPGIVVVDPIGALARLQLGRAYAMQGDTIKAKAQYHDFLTLWKDADPNVPILKQAQTESSKLNYVPSQK